jgi:hypothetical protein
MKTTKTTNTSAELSPEVLQDLADVQVLDLIHLALDAFEAAESEGDSVRARALREAIVTAYDALQPGGDFAAEIALLRTALRPAGGWLH